MFIMCKMEIEKGTKKNISFNVWSKSLRNACMSLLNMSKSLCSTCMSLLK